MEQQRALQQRGAQQPCSMKAAWRKAVAAGKAVVMKDSSDEGENRQDSFVEGAPMQLYVTSLFGALKASEDLANYHIVLFLGQNGAKAPAWLMHSCEEQ
eukprot:1155915-Pelagomonas_calceolata.AAC.3